MPAKFKQGKSILITRINPSRIKINNLLKSLSNFYFSTSSTNLKKAVRGVSIFFPSLLEQINLRFKHFFPHMLI